jgi:sulfate permease, SulP family
LAAVLMVTAARMISWRVIVRIIRSSRSAAAAFSITAVVTICFDLIQAVEIGVLVTAVFALAAVARRSGVRREDLPFPHQSGDEHIVLLRLDGAMFFGAAERISTEILDAPHAQARVVIIALSQLGMLDATGAHALARIAEELESRGITVIIKGVQPEHRDLLANVGIIASLRHENHLIETLEEAVAHARRHATAAGRAAQ